jgi:hypothetical protein
MRDRELELQRAPTCESSHKIIIREYYTCEFVALDLNERNEDEMRLPGCALTKSSASLWRFSCERNRIVCENEITIEDGPE